jgi:hypothetical protein
MYRFFTVACAIDARRLPDWEQTVKDNGFYKKLEGMFYSAFIKASLWIKGPT